jgi:hypothetical protein
MNQEQEQNMNRTKELNPKQSTYFLRSQNKNSSLWKTKLTYHGRWQVSEAACRRLTSYQNSFKNHEGRQKFKVNLPI